MKSKINSESCEHGHKNGGTTCHGHGLEESMLLKCHAIQSDLQIQCNPYQNTNAFFTELEKNSYGISKTKK
jgi:hypothetical protein